MLYSLYAAFCSWDGISEPVLIGLANFKQMFTEDDKFWTSVWNTLHFTVFSVPINLAVALLLAVALNQKHWGKSLFRALFYLPSVAAGVAIYIVWSNLYNPTVGIINYLLSFLGIQGPEWLLDPAWAMPSIIIMSITFCGSTMLIFLAGLQDIPETAYEAARLDGAGPFTMFFRITLPLLSPVIFYNLIMGLIGALQVFAQPWIMTQGGPIDATYVYGIHLYNNAFRYYNFGYACALAWMLFVLIMLLSLFVMRTSKSWVYSEASDN